MCNKLPLDDDDDDDCIYNIKMENGRNWNFPQARELPETPAGDTCGATCEYTTWCLCGDVPGVDGTPGS